MPFAFSHALRRGAHYHSLSACKCRRHVKPIYGLIVTPYKLSLICTAYLRGSLPVIDALQLSSKARRARNANAYSGLAGGM